MLRSVLYRHSGNVSQPQKRLPQGMRQGHVRDALLTRVLIAGGQPCLRHGVRASLQDHSPAYEVAEAISAGDVFSALREGTCDVVVLDVAGGGRAFDVVRRLRQDHPTVPVLVLSAGPEERYGLLALKAGAAGYLSKSCSVPELAEAIDCIVSGRVHLRPVVARQMVAEVFRPPVRHGQGTPILSEREREVLDLLAAGQRPVHIAAMLRLSVKTVSTYRRRLLKKLDLTSSTGLIRYAIEQSLLQSQSELPRKLRG